MEKLVALCLLAIVQVVSSETNICGRAPDVATAENGVKFYLYSQDNQGIHGSIPVLTPDDVEINSEYIPSFRTDVIIHGNMSSPEGIHTMATQILFHHNYVNVIVVDWKKRSLLETGGANTQFVGKEVAKFITNLVNHNAVIANFHLIGEGLGAHVAGFAGQELKGKIGRLTALAPTAGTCFGESAAGKRLSSDDAVFVDVIYTGGNNVFKDENGVTTKLGDAEFYPNGGDDQPGCTAEVAGCNRKRAAAYFTESINRKNLFTALPCTQVGGDWVTNCVGSCWGSDNDCSRLGYFASTSKKGDFYLTTETQSPYSKDISLWK